MASRISRKGASFASPQPGDDSNSSRGSRTHSPLSPTRQTRLQEKVELQNLNDRLADYIDRVRHLETENSRLTREIQTSETTVKREVSNIKLMYEKELSDIRQLLDDTAREKAKFEIDLKRYLEENEELKHKLEKTSKDLAIADGQLRNKTLKLDSLQNSYDQIMYERSKTANQLKDNEKELAKLQKQLAELRKGLEDETLKRVDLENHMQSLKEDMSFKEQLFQKTITETQTKRKIEVSEIDGRLAKDYNIKLQEALQDLREQYEAQMNNNRAEIEMLYENKIKNLQSAANRNSLSTSNAFEDLRKSRVRIDELSSRTNELEGLNSALHARIRELEQALENARLRHADDLTILENELTRLRDEMAQQMQEYQDLMDIKISLDLEISAYRKLLEGEEARLNISLASTNGKGNSSVTTSSTAGRGSINTRSSVGRTTGEGSTTKRKRTIVEETISSSSTVTRK